MSKILIAWELGSGLGHIGPLRAIGIELVARGHSVTIATVPDNVGLCRQAQVGTGLQLVSVPALPLTPPPASGTSTYADLLLDCGYSSPVALTEAVGVWLQLLRESEPDLLVADHSPTALLANTIAGRPSVATGTGFVCPPDVAPLPDVNANALPSPSGRDTEANVLNCMNMALAAHGGSELARVSEIFARVEETLLLTLPEIDHYAPWRENDKHHVEYLQPVGNLPGVRCEWPAGAGISPDGPRVFVYLRQRDMELPLLRGLALKRIATVCYSARLTTADRASFDGSSVVVASTPIDLEPLLTRCDVGVLHCGIGTVSQMLRAGVAMLLLPGSLEQSNTARRLVELGVALAASVGDLNAVATGLERLLEEPSFRDAAKAFAELHPSLSEAAAVREIVDRLEATINS